MCINVLLIFWTINDPLCLLALLFLFLLVQDGTSLFFSHQKLNAKSFLGYLVVFWTSIVGRKKYVYCFSEKKKVMRKFNLSKVMFPLGVVCKLILYVSLFCLFAFFFEERRDSGLLIFFVIIGLISELLFYGSFYFTCCHVWKDISPAKRNLKIFSSEFEINSDEKENMTLLNRNP
jgi:hypothetical protein